MSSQEKLIGVCHAGIGWTETEWHTFRVVFHDFGSLPHYRGAEKLSPTFEVHGYEWRLTLFPGGSASSDQSVTNIGLSLTCVDAQHRNATVQAKFRFCIPTADDVKIESRTVTFEKVNLSENKHDSWSIHNFVPRDHALDPSKHILVNGNLIIEVGIQVMLETPPEWKPSNTVCADMLQMLESANQDNADVLFQVGEKRRKKQKFFAHSQVLKARAPALAALVEGYDTDTPFPINDIEPTIFRQLLRFVYGGDVPVGFDLGGEAQKMITVADRFGFTGLKLAAESELAASGITIENAAELILFSDSKNCAELKEAATDFFVSNSEAVMKSDGFANIRESPSITMELMSALGTVASGKRKRASSSSHDENNYYNMRVRVLRRKLSEKGLDVDGSKEVLVRRLEEADANASESD